LYSLPGNSGTAQYGTNLAGNPLDRKAVATAARQHRIDLAVIGPEAPLGIGLADALRAEGLRVFGPSQAAAQIETSKAFAKAFMGRHGIPTAAYATFRDLPSALADLRSRPIAAHGPPPIVIKASGLAAGKGVFLPGSLGEAEEILHGLLVEGILEGAGREVIIEDRLAGPEVSVLAFSDGQAVLPMPPAQDHKRLLEGDEGPNTGGMGAFAPTPLCPPGMLAEIRRMILQPAVDGLRSEGRPFVGVLYAGLILTSRGPQVLEFNARFGDPETQVILPLLETDLVDLLIACSDGRLEEAAQGVRWGQGAAAVVVLASQGYGYSGGTRKGAPIMGLDDLPANVWAFHAGTGISGGHITTAGGRVLGITAVGRGLAEAVGRAYEGVSRIHFAGMFYREDIGRSILDGEMATHGKNRGFPLPSAYAASGVSIQTGNQAVAEMRQDVRSTYSPEVLSDVGAFGGLFRAAALKEMEDPVLVASTDGVGTKVLMAAQAGRYAGIGEDIVNHCLNDILVQGGRPLFFLDYFATGRLEPKLVSEVVGGMSRACRASGCVLLGGETAEMPGVYLENSFDVAGTVVGVVERSQILPRLDIAPGDLLLGLASSGPHTNGFSLIRRVFAGIPLDTVYPELGVPLGDLLLVPHRSYLPVLAPLVFDRRSSEEDNTVNIGQRASVRGPIKALAHVTGGGFLENLPRVLPAGLGAHLRKDSWPVQPIFRLIQRLGEVPEGEMYHVFNMGIGIIMVLSPSDLASVRSALSEPAWVIGELVPEEGVTLVAG
jgi:phosphoribosylamine--glycine ligase/phosphoribosylaminoimidazole synthetase